MIIKQLEIEKLHGEYNYDIYFNKDITFLYGPNGCGKTTILTILSSIVTGKYYYLVNYNFSSVKLTYSPDNSKTEHIIYITITHKENNNAFMKITSDKINLKIEDINTLHERIVRTSEDDFDLSFEQMYPEIIDLKKIFHYVYLPLNRLASTENIQHFDSPFRRRRMYFNQDFSNTYLNESLIFIEKLIKDSINKINLNEILINNKFRKKILSSVTRITKDNSLSKILSDIDSTDITEVQRVKNAYINTLMELDIFDVEVEEKIEQFIEEFTKEYENHKNDENKISISYAFLYNDYLRIKEVVEFAKENEKQKNKNRHNIDLFIEVINDFFKTSGTDKTIEITDEAKINFNTHNRPLQLKDLSSGEKQLIIIFASYIFGIEDNLSGIYIVDEPEASLHLEWQSKFVESLLKTNKKIQLIFATHSPELIGQYNNRAERLIRNQG